MNILLFGSSGFIGKKVVDLLRSQKHTLITPTSREIDFTRPDDLNLKQIKSLMQNMDVVINMVGIMTNDKALMENVHHQTPARLAKIAKSQNVKKWINLSALGADEHSKIAFVGSKGRGDKAILDLANENFEVKIARPSLVFGLGKNGEKGGASTELFLKLANSPMIVLPNGGNFTIQPVHVDDVALGLVKLATQDQNLPKVINFTGAKVLTLAEYLTALRITVLGKSKPKILPILMSLAKFSASVLKNFSSIVSVDSLTLLEHGNTADNADFSRLLGYEPKNFLLKYKNI